MPFKLTNTVLATRQDGKHKGLNSFAVSGEMSQWITEDPRMTRGFNSTCLYTLYTGPFRPRASPELYFVLLCCNPFIDLVLWLSDGPKCSITKVCVDDFVRH